MRDRTKEEEPAWGKWKLQRSCCEQLWLPDPRPELSGAPVPILTHTAQGRLQLEQQLLVRWLYNRELIWDVLSGPNLNKDLLDCFLWLQVEAT